MLCWSISWWWDNRITNQSIYTTCNLFIINAVLGSALYRVTYLLPTVCTHTTVPTLRLLGIDVESSGVRADL